MAKKEVIHFVRYIGYRITLCGLPASASDLAIGSWHSWGKRSSEQMVCSGCETHWMAEGLDIKPITDEDRGFIKEMKERMPNLSISNKRDR